MADVKKLNNWVKEAQWAASEWRAESWRDSEMLDGGDAQWNYEDQLAAEAAGIDRITINRTFPTVNYLLGIETLNSFDITAKGRTKYDTETSQVMTEGIKFVMDQSDGQFLVSQAFKDQIVPGFGCLHPCLEPDPRKEKLAIKYRDWKEIWWDPFAPPWFKPALCRYVFYQRWMDLDALTSMFYEKRREIEDKYQELCGAWSDDYSSYFGDEADLVEEEKRLLAGIDWADNQRKRVRPVEMWYPVYTPAHFAVFPNGNAREITEELVSKNPLEAYAMVTGAQQVVAAIVQKMRVCTFLDDLVLMESPSPYPHDEYPFVPFIGYLDRWNFPYGVPRQIRDQDVEVNKRRSMALAMLNSRRVLAEKSAAKDDEERQAQYEEAQKLNGYIVVPDGALAGGKFQIVDEANLSAPQVAILEKDEQEIREITGQITAGVIAKSNPISGRAIDKAEASSTVPSSATLFLNLRRSLKMLGEQTMANMQKYWQGEKILRITDSITGAERFEILNQRVSANGQVMVRNDITQGKYDLVVTDTPHSDTIREKNLELLIETAKKSPPEAIGPLLIASFELSNLPNKEQLLLKIKPLLGGDPREDEMTPTQIKEKVIAQLEAQQQEQAEARELAKAAAELELLTKRAEIEKKKAEILRLKAEAQKKLADIKSTAFRVGNEYQQTQVSAAESQGKLSNERKRLEIEDAKAMAEIAKAAHEITEPVIGDS